MTSILTNLTNSSGVEIASYGPACITANRVYVPKGVYERFASILEKRTRKPRMGRCIHERTTHAALTILNGLDKAAAQVEDTKKYGGQVLLTT